jgi:hypothetical protein
MPVPKVATPHRTDMPATDSKLQALIGDPTAVALSAFAQFAPPDLEEDLRDLTPSQGDDIFLTYLIPGARFQDKLGRQWEIEEYGFEGKVQIRNLWYSRDNFICSVQDIRRTIHSWIHPIQQIVPPAPAHIDYGTIDVKVVS